MSAECWKCKQKAEYRQQKINAARAEAVRLATEIGETMAVVKTTGCIFEVKKASETEGLNVVEFISV